MVTLYIHTVIMRLCEFLHCCTAKVRHQNVGHSLSPPYHPCSLAQVLSLFPLYFSFLLTYLISHSLSLSLLAFHILPTTFPWHKCRDVSLIFSSSYGSIGQVDLLIEISGLKTVYNIFFRFLHFKNTVLRETKLHSK
jgi:hypothetical protein